MTDDPARWVALLIEETLRDYMLGVPIGSAEGDRQIVGVGMDGMASLLVVLSGGAVVRVDAEPEP